MVPLFTQSISFAQKRHRSPTNPILLEQGAINDTIKLFLGPNGYADAINSPWISSPVTETIKATRWVTDAFNKEGGHLPSSHSGVQGLLSDPLVMTHRDIKTCFV